jgi:hypothetical protein
LPPDLKITKELKRLEETQPRNLNRSFKENGKSRLMAMHQFNYNGIDVDIFIKTQF